MKLIRPIRPDTRREGWARKVESRISSGLCNDIYGYFRDPAWGPFERFGVRASVRDSIEKIVMGDKP